MQFGKTLRLDVPFVAPDRFSDKGLPRLDHTLHAITDLEQDSFHGLESDVSRLQICSAYPQLAKLAPCHSRHAKVSLQIMQQQLSVTRETI